MPIRRINLWSGPGAGKSTMAAWIFYQLRMLKLSVELTHEVVKEDAYNKRPIEGAYQIRRFGEQMDVEDRFLRNGVKYIVSDSPLLLQSYYSSMRGESFYHSMVSQANYFENRFPSLNIFLDREGIPYDINGRFQSKDEALQVDRELQTFMKAVGVKYHVVRTVDQVKLLETVLGGILDMALIEDQK